MAVAAVLSDKDVQDALKQLQCHSERAEALLTSINRFLHDCGVSLHEVKQNSEDIEKLVMMWLDKQENWLVFWPDQPEGYRGAKLQYRYCPVL